MPFTDIVSLPSLTVGKDPAVIKFWPFTNSLLLVGIKVSPAIASSDALPITILFFNVLSAISVACAGVIPVLAVLVAIS